MLLENDIKSIMVGLEKLCGGDVTTRIDLQDDAFLAPIAKLINSNFAHPKQACNNAQQGNVTP